MTGYRVILNPVSGRGAAEQAAPEIERQLAERGLDFAVVRTERPWHAAELAQQAVRDGVDVVVAAGGDGTSNEVLNGLMLAKTALGDHKTAMGVLSVGQGNDFAFGAGIPKDLPAACDVLAANKRRRIDVGRVRGGLYPEGRYFGNGVGVGFDAVVGFEAFKLKRLHGFAAYAVAALRTMVIYYPAPVVRVSCGLEVLSQGSLMVSVMNGRRMGGGFMMTPQSAIDDGLLDLCVAGDIPRRKVLPLILRFMKGTQAGHPGIRFLRGREVTIEAVRGVLPAHADGETLCVDGQRLDIEVLSQQLDMLSLVESVVGEESR